MIVSGTLSPERKDASRRNLNRFSLINGFSYMCLGEALIILFAVKLHCPDYFISSLGAMIYFGFLLLPMGKWVTARIGAARCQALFWVCRNGAALMVAATSVVAWSGHEFAAAILLLIGTFLFYGFRAAGVVMSQPLIGDITDEATRGQFIAANTGLFYIGGLFSLALISGVLKISQELWVLTGIIIVGAALGVFASTFIRKIDETERIRESAKKPIWSELRQVWAIDRFRKQLMVGYLVNVSIIMVIPVSVLTLKRGYQVSDTGALLFSLVQFTASAVMSHAAGRFSEKVGPRRVILTGLLLMLLVAAAWLVAPDGISWIFATALFFAIGSATVSMANSLTHYFLQSIPEENRVATSIFNAVTGGAGAGITGMLLAGGLLQLAAWMNPDANIPLTTYRYYFTMTLMLLIVAFRFAVRLEPLPYDLRKRRVLFEYLFSK